MEGNIPQQQPDAQQAALEAIYAGRVRRKEGYCEVPTQAFISKVDANMPELPAIPFFSLGGERDETPEQVRAPDEPWSAMALSMNPKVWVTEKDFLVVRSFAESLILGKQMTPGTGEGAAPPLSADKRIETLRRSAIMVVEDLFDNPTPENITKSVKMVGSFVYVIMKEPKAYSMLSRLSSHDPYTLQHSVGTSVHGIILGRKIGITNEAELTELGAAGLLHDIGKTKVKKEIINKKGPLDDVEWEEMRSHATEGFEIVKDQPSVSVRTKRAVLEHHEDRNGTGYPHGKRTADIDIFSRIVCLCDMFNALTTDRSYSKARTPLEAFQFMREKLMHKVDADLFASLVLIYGGKLS